MRKLSLGLTLLLLLAMVLSACGAPSAPAAEAPADTAAEAEAAPAAAAEPTPVINNFGECDDPLVLWHGLTGSDGAVFAELLAQFSEQNPDVCLNSEGYPWDIFFQKYPTAVAAGTPPDMVIFHAAEVNQMASEGLMLPMDDIIFSDGTLDKAEFNDVLIDAITIEGNTMAVPFDNHGWLLWYNTKLMEDAGLDPDALPQIAGVDRHLR